MVERPSNLKIWQQNVNKSPACQHDLISNKALVIKDISIIALQEPAINFLNLTISAKDWTVIYPTTHSTSPDKTRTVLMVRAALVSDSWTQLDFPSGDVTAMQLKGARGKLTILNIYNDGKDNATIQMLSKYHNENATLLERTGELDAHVIWLGDFNRHHPHWDDPADTRLFTPAAMEAAETLIEAVADAGLELVLPSGIPTHYHNVTKRWSRLDQVFLSEQSTNIIIACETRPDTRGINTDHLPIVTELDLEAVITKSDPLHNFRDIDWEQFRSALSGRLSSLQPPRPIIRQEELDAECSSITEAIQETIAREVPITEITPKSKRWWTKELTQLRKYANKTGRKAYKWRQDPEHPIHKEHNEASNTYAKAIKYNKQQFWRDWLERADEPDLWTAQRMVSGPATDGGKARIPPLKHRLDGTEVTAKTNTDKSRALAKGFFPPKPQPDEEEVATRSPKPCSAPIKITKEQLLKHLKKLKPYKAPGPDGIPNVLLSKCADMLLDRLFHVYTAMLNNNLQYAPWKSFVTVVLRKPGKPRYDLPKAYRPIALLNTMWKLLAAVVAEHITFLSEKHQLLPAHHFGGRPGRTTTDAMHLLTYKIKEAWRAGKVTAVLFLDIEGAFPNAVPSKLTQNLRKRRIPDRYVDFVSHMLQERKTTLKFDGYESDPIHIDNGIGQGDPLSMVLYQFYNADLLDIPKDDSENAIAYVDDSLMLATAKTFKNAHRKLSDMMSRVNGVADWSAAHNSPLEYSKLALIDFAHRSVSRKRPALVLPQITVKPVESTKYLGVIFSQHLQWNAQIASVAAKGSSWTAQIRRLARPSWGLTPSSAKRLFIGVAIPRILYAFDVWGLSQTVNRNRAAVGSAKAIRVLTNVQRAGAIAITGGLRTSPSDSLDATANLLPAPLTIKRWCHRAMVRLAMLPSGHPLAKPVARKNLRTLKRHRAPLHNLARSFEVKPNEMEKIPADIRHPAQTGKVPFHCFVAEDKETAVRIAGEASEEIQVFSDGSAISGKVGAAAILMRKGNPVRMLQCHLGPDSEHTVHEAELVGLLLGLHLISTERRSRTTCAIGIDNQAVFGTLQSDLRNPGQHLAREIIKLGNRLQKERKRSAFTMTIRWVAGHEGIEGNELADHAAKEAARGAHTDKHLLPSYLRKRIPINPSALKQDIKVRLSNEWKKDWRSSVRGKAMAKLDGTTPSAKFLESISHPEISRSTASSIAQLRLTHVPVNEYLYRFKRVDSTRCPACGEDTEDITHFLLSCPGYAHERWALAQKAAKISKPLNLATLLGVPAMALPLAEFLESTQRFENKTQRAE
jgi:ribonuclease HI/exonuclease III